MLPSLEKWQNYFIENGLHRDTIDWQSNEPLTASERQTIARSIAAFQLGENSEGKGLMKSANEFAKAHNDQYLSNITVLFIKEEQHHAHLLRRFMDLQGIPVIKKNWTDAIFRKMRKDVGFELSLLVLITAEILSLVYYQALRDCTGSMLLKTICNKILTEEFAHISYESGLLNFIFNQHRSPIRNGYRLLHRSLFCCTMLVVYFSHTAVITSGGFSFTSYWRACWQAFNNYFGKVAENKRTDTEAAPVAKREHEVGLV